jgi:hypothetical protein
MHVGIGVGIAQGNSGPRKQYVGIEMIRIRKDEIRMHLQS